MPDSKKVQLFKMVRQNHRVAWYQEIGYTYYNNAGHNTMDFHVKRI